MLHLYKKVVLKNENFITVKCLIMIALNGIFSIFQTWKRKKDMNKHNGIRPQDIVILLKMITLGDKLNIIE